MVLPPYPLERSNRRSNVLVGNGATITWGPFAYKISAIEDVKVYRKDLGESRFSIDESALVEKTAGLEIDTFTITIDPPMPATTQWYHQGARVHERSTAITKATQLDTTALDKELTKQAHVLQELRRDVSGAILAEPGVTPPVLAGPLTPNTLLITNAAGNIASSSVTADDVAAAGNAAADADRAEAALAEFYDAVDARLTIKLQTVTVAGQTVYPLDHAVPAFNGHQHVNAFVGGVLQPKDGAAYTITSGGAAITLSEDPGDGKTLYVEGASSYSVNTVDSGLASSVGNDSAVPGTTVKDALEAVFAATGVFAAWPSAVTRTMQERSKYICHIADFDADPTGANDSTDALEDWLAEAQNGGVKGVIGSDGSGPYNYIIERELEITKPGQVLHFDQTGGYAYGDNFGDTWQANGKLTVAGSWFAATGKRVRTRRLFRGSAVDPQDDPISAVINIQAQGVRLENPHIWLYKDYGLSSPTDYGADVDVAIFNGCRVGVEIDHPTIVGHFRKAGLYFDVSHRAALARHLSRAGVPYQDGSELSGSDGCRVFEPYIRGSRKAIAILGARPKIGQTGYTDAYYDQQLGTTISDARGAVGFSDFYCQGGKLWSFDHESDYRVADPTLSGGALNQASLLAEPDNMPAIVHIDGLANNTSGAIWNMSFHRTRFATFEAFRARLDFASRVTFDNCHFDGRNSYDGLGAGRKNTSGVAIDTNVYTAPGNTYGDVAGTPNTSRVKVLGTPRSSIANGIGPHYYGANMHFETALGLVSAPNFASPGDLDIASGDGTTMPGNSPPGPAIILRNGLATALKINYHVNGAYGTTTGSAANLNLSSGNLLARSTSSIKYKFDVEDLSAQARDVIMELRPVWYRSLCAIDNPAWSHYGFIAEEVAAIDPRLVHFRTEEFYIDMQMVIKRDDDGKEITAYEPVELSRKLDTPIPEGVQYDRLTPHIVAKLQQFEQRISVLLARVEALEAERGTP